MFGIFAFWYTLSHMLSLIIASVAAASFEWFEPRNAPVAKDPETLEPVIEKTALTRGCKCIGRVGIFMMFLFLCDRYLQPRRVLADSGL